MENKIDILIIGAGASGMTAGICAAEKAAELGLDLSICILEKTAAAGSKIRISGNGRCNITNSGCGYADLTVDFFRYLGLMIRETQEGRMYPYNGRAETVVDVLTGALDRLGVPVEYSCEVKKIEINRMWIRGKAHRVCLTHQSTAGAEAGIADECGKESNTDICGTVSGSKNIGKAGNAAKFKITLSDGRILYADKVMIATGGKSYPKCGTTGDGYVMARELGHTVSRLAPALTPVDTVEDVTALRKIRVNGQVKLFIRDESEGACSDGSSRSQTQDDNCSDVDEGAGHDVNAAVGAEAATDASNSLHLIDSETGEIQFTETGLSGVCVFDLSRFIKLPPGKSIKDGFRDYEIHIDMAPDISTDDLETIMNNRYVNVAALDHVSLDASRDGAGETTSERPSRGKSNTASPAKDSELLKTGEIPEDAMKKVLASIVPHQAAEYMTSAYEITGFAEAAALLKCLPFHVRGLQGWKKAQVTSGGVSKYEIDPAAMESRLIEGLFFGGEVIDEDHPCGGYNLQHAWETGMICGNAMAAASAGRESEENGKL